jgi:hypothetical protein
MSLVQQQQQQPEAAGPSGRSGIIPAPAPQPPRSGLPRRSGSSNSLGSGCTSPPHPAMPHPGEIWAGCPPAVLEQHVRSTPPQPSLRPAASAACRCRHAPHLWLGCAHPCVPRLPRPRGRRAHRPRRFAARRCAGASSGACHPPLPAAAPHPPPAVPRPHVTLFPPSSPAVFPAGGSPPLPTGFISVPLHHAHHHTHHPGHHHPPTHSIPSEPGSPTARIMYSSSPPPYGASPPYGSSPPHFGGSPPPGALARAPAGYLHCRNIPRAHPRWKVVALWSDVNMTQLLPV